MMNLQILFLVVSKFVFIEAAFNFIEITTMSPKLVHESNQVVENLTHHGYRIDQGNKYLSFYLKAPRDGIMRLYDDKNPNICGGKGYYILYMCTDYNKEIAFHSESLTDSYKVNNLCNENYYRPFWVSWNEGKLEAGFGTEPFTNRAIVNQGIGYFTVSSIEITTANHATGEWRILSFVSTDKTQLMFRVKKNVVPASEPLEIATSKNIGHCAILCYKNIECMSFAFISSTRECRWYSESNNGSVIALDKYSGSLYYH